MRKQAPKSAENEEEVEVRKETRCGVEWAKCPQLVIVCSSFELLFAIDALLLWKMTL